MRKCYVARQVNRLLRVDHCRCHHAHRFHVPMPYKNRKFHLDKHYIFERIK
uniref:Ovule protein n=1 Tax=Ascaris lumbricoides TaxID=6252 RepID=A0A0M3HK66_ASCLU